MRNSSDSLRHYLLSRLLSRLAVTVAGTSFITCTYLLCIRGPCKQINAEESPSPSSGRKPWKKQREQAAKERQKDIGSAHLNILRACVGRELVNPVLREREPRTKEKGPAPKVYSTSVAAREASRSPDATVKRRCISLSRSLPYAPSAHCTAKRVSNARGTAPEEIQFRWIDLRNYLFLRTFQK